MAVPCEALAKHGGEGGIRTHGDFSATPDFESGALDHSATSPCRRGRLCRPPRKTKAQRFGADRGRASRFSDSVNCSRGRPPRFRRGERRPRAPPPGRGRHSPPGAPPPRLQPEPMPRPTLHIQTLGHTHPDCRNLPPTQTCHGLLFWLSLHQPSRAGRPCHIAWVSQPFPTERPPKERTRAQAADGLESHPYQIDPPPAGLTGGRPWGGIGAGLQLFGFLPPHA
jgi:hypothetical protein